MGAGDCFELYDCVHPRYHHYDRGNREQLYRFLNRHFELNTPHEELPWQSEILTESERNVGIPTDNQTLHSLAREQLISIKRTRSPAHSKRDGRRPHTAHQKATARRKLRQLIRMARFDKIAARGIERRVLRAEVEWQHRVLRLDRS